MDLISHITQILTNTNAVVIVFVIPLTICFDRDRPSLHDIQKIQYSYETASILICKHHKLD